MLVEGQGMRVWVVLGEKALGAPGQKGVCWGVWGKQSALWLEPRVSPVGVVGSWAGGGGPSGLPA